MKLIKTIMDSNSKDTSPPLNQKALAFVIYENGSFVIPEEARTLLSNESYQNIGIMSLVGKYRTGKSFLLNRVLLNRKQQNGFGVGPTFKPCTKGIWIWSDPMMISNSYCKEPFPCFLIDTEGLGAYDEEVNHDSKIFLIAILISSLFIFNSFSAIDETAIHNLSFVLNLSKTIKLHNNSTFDNENDLAEYFPTLLWLLRDFHLKLEDTEGNVITEKQYLENSLQNVKGSTDTIEQKNQVRTLIRTYFPERDCYTMVRPVEKESDLQNLQHLEDMDLRKEFVEQARIFRVKVLKKVKPKVFMKKPLTGRMLVDLVQSVLDAINKGSIPVIENSWKYVIQSEYIKNTTSTIEKFKADLEEFQKANDSKPTYFKDVKQYSQELLWLYLASFEKKSLIDEDNKAEFIGKLRLKLSAEIEKFDKENEKLCEEKFQADIETATRSFIGSFESDKYAKNYYLFFQDLEQFKAQSEESTPEFPVKREILFEKLLHIVKRFIETFFIKNKLQTEKQIGAYKTALDKQQAKLKMTTDELSKIKQEHSNYLEKMNNSIIDEKLKQKSFEEKLLTVQNEKKIERERYERSLQQLKSDYEKKYESALSSNNKSENELRVKEEQMLMIRLNNEKLASLNEQKIGFLDKELSALKEKYAELQSESQLREKAKNEEITALKAQNDSLRIANQKTEANSHEVINNSFNSLSLFLREHFKLQSEENKNMLEQVILTQQKESSTDKDLLFNYKETTEKNQKLTLSLSSSEMKIKQLEEQLSKMSNYKLLIHKTAGFKCKICLKVFPYDQFKSHIKTCQKDMITSMGVGLTNRNREPIEKIKLKLLKGRVKQDEVNKPYLEYIIDVTYNNQNWRVNKRFNQFANLYKTIKTLFQGIIAIPSSANIFVNLNEMNLNNSFHENKILQLDKFIKDLAEIEVVNCSKIFRKFLEFERFFDEEVIDNEAGFKAHMEEENKEKEEVKCYGSDMEEDSFKIEENEDNSHF